MGQTGPVAPSFVCQTAIEVLMRTLILLTALLPGMATAAEQPKKKPPEPIVNCAQYGDGFVQVKGTNTCVKVGGSVQIDVGVKASPPR